jgi:hypothetical protein
LRPIESDDHDPEGTVKSTVDEIRQRFDADVERFSNLETGQSATVDAPLAMEIIAERQRPRHQTPVTFST